MGLELGKNTTLVILVVALLAVGAYVFVNTSFDKQVISVTGNAEISAKPELVSVYISVETTNSSAEDSKNENSRISEDVIRELRFLGFKDSDIETVSYNIYQDYSWENNRQELKGYKTVNQLKVKTDNFDLTGKIVDAAVDSGALIQYINFELNPENESKLKAEAIEKATMDAKSKAEAVAKGADKKLGSLISVNTNDYYYQPYGLYAKGEDVSASVNAAEARSATVKINPQELTVSANVQAVYGIR
ncbi:MAG TPA: SIMPL domain-containing protein [Candidatus Nanoarchaeia archaeon]|nr:SIMPL domain-containing protein [Candidatus Nanoarchaeia archaeon]